VSAVRVLAIDTSCGACSVAVWDGARRELLAGESLVMAQGHAEALAPMVQRVAQRVEGGVDALDRIAVCVGPGSFTGIRIGLAMARAMGLALPVPVVGVSALVAFAAPLLVDPAPGVIASVIDARHGQVYFQLFEASGRPMMGARVARLKDVVRAIGGAAARAVGNAADLLAEEGRRSGVEIDAGAGSNAPDIAAIAQLGVVADPATSPPRPLYIKAPDAQPSAGAAIPHAQG